MYIDKKYFLFFGLGALLAAVQVSAQGPEAADADNEIKVSFQFRPRLEVRDGAFRPLAGAEKPAVLISERSRMKLDYGYKNFLEIRLAPQSVSVWGQANMVQGAENSGNRISLFETWARLRIATGFDLQLGRQIISLDDERFFGELDWAQGGRAHDAVRLNFRKNGYEAKVFLALNQNYAAVYGNNLSNPSGSLYSTADALPYKWMQVVWAASPLGKKSKLTVLVANLGLQDLAASDTAVHFLQTFGANYFYKGTSVKGNISAYLQTGKNMSGKNTGAYLASASLSYHLNNHFDLGAGSDFLSGNKVAAVQNGNRAFNPFFHTGHKFYGAMDYFYSGNPHKEAGLSDSYLNLGYKRKDYGVNIAFHQFFTTAAVFYDTGEMEANLGQELDLNIQYEINNMVSLAGGYSFFLNTETLDYLKDVAAAGKYQQWAWLSLNITPVFFKSKF